MKARLVCAAAAAATALALVLVPVSRLVAEERPAQVSALEGTASRTARSGARAALAEGAPVSEGDTIETGPASRLELRFADRSVLRLGAEAKLRLSVAQFGGGPAKRRMSVRLFLGNLWAKVTSVVSGDQQFEVETENAVAGVRGTTFRVDARADQSVRVRVYAGAVAVAENRAGGAGGAQGGAADGGRREVAGPQEISRGQWEKLVGRQMQLIVAADGTPGEPTPIAAGADRGDAWARWNEQRDREEK